MSLFQKLFSRLRGGGSSDTADPATALRSGQARGSAQGSADTQSGKAASRDTASKGTASGDAASGNTPVRGTVSKGTVSGGTASGSPVAELGFLVFEQTGDVLAAENALKKAGYAVEVKSPPPALRKGCDMVLVCPIMKQVEIRSLLERVRVHPLDFVPVSDPLLEPVSFFHTTDYGDWFMVRAANMKIVVEKATGTIVNVSGGGCPDVPHLAGLLQGCRLGGDGPGKIAEEPRLRGRTLCSYALQRAFEEARRIWRG